MLQAHRKRLEGSGNRSQSRSAFILLVCGRLRKTLDGGVAWSNRKSQFREE